MSSSGANTGLARIVGANIRRARLSAGLTQRQLSVHLDINAMAISNWERGEYRPSAANLVALSEVLGLDLGWFYTEHEPDGAEAA